MGNVVTIDHMPRSGFHRRGFGNLKQESNIMKLPYFLLWLAGGGLVLVEIYFCSSLLRFSQVHEDAQDERLWELLLRSGRS
jgi:hypothetical protein